MYVSPEGIPVYPGTTIAFCPMLTGGWLPEDGGALGIPVVSLL